MCDPLSLGQLKIPTPVHNRSPITPSLAHHLSVFNRHSSVIQNLFHTTRKYVTKSYLSFKLEPSSVLTDTFLGVGIMAETVAAGM